MIETYATNNYLKNQLNRLENSLSDDGDVPEEVFIDFINELNVSTLMIAGIVHDDDLDFEVLATEDEDMQVIALFTDEEEFSKNYPGDSEYEPLANDIGVYIELIRDNDIDGLVINPSSSEFFLEKDLLLELPLNNKEDVEDDSEAYSAGELYRISRDATNDSLLDFIRSDNDSFEQLMNELSKSTLLNLVVSEEDLTGHAVDNIISRDDVGEFSLCATGSDDTHFGIVFTDIDAIKQTLDDEDNIHCYCQLTLLDDFMEFILLNDMDGIIINPGLDDYLISREYLLEAYHGLTYNHPGFKNAADYAFII